MANGKMATEVIEQSHITKEKRASLRKSNKPIMEKRRRARINSCLTQLKSLVLDGMRKDSSQYSKLEKADILEMTVRHLRNVQRQQMSTAIATDPNVVTKYRAGFNECAGEVFRYLNNVQCVNEDARTKIVSHLSHCLQNVNTQPKTTSQVQQHQQITSLPCQNNISANLQQTPNVQPLSVQIPQHSDINNNLTQQFSSSSSHSASSSSSSSSLLQQQQSTCLLMPGNIQQATCNSSSSPTLVNVSTPITVTSNNQNISRSFQIVPGNMYNGPVAVYVGQVSDSQRSPVASTTAMPVYTVQMNTQHHQMSHLNSNKENFKVKHINSQDTFAGSIQSNILSVANLNQPESSDNMWRPW